MQRLVAPVTTRVRTAVGGLPPVYWALLAGMFVNRLATFVATFLGLYLVRGRGFTAEQAGPVVGLYGVGMLLGAPVGGLLADAVGRRATMLASFALGSVAVATLGFLRAPAALAACTLVAAFTSELYRPAMNAAVADVVPVADRRRTWGLAYWAMNVGWTAGVLLGGLLAERGWVLLFLADATTTLAFAAIVLRRVPETRPRSAPAAEPRSASGPPGGPRSAPAAEPRSASGPPGPPDARAHSPLAGLARTLRDGPFAAFLALHLAGLAVFVQFGFTLPVAMSGHGLGPPAIGGVLMLNGIVVVVLQPFQQALLGQHDGSRLLAASALLFGTGYGVCALAGPLPPLPVYVAGALLWSVGEVVGFPVAAALVADLAPVELRGRYQGAFSMCWGLAFTLSPVLGGAVLARLGARTLFLGCLAVGVAAAVGHLAAAPARRRRLSPALSPVREK